MNHTLRDDSDMPDMPDMPNPNGHRIRPEAIANITGGNSYGGVRPGATFKIGRCAKYGYCLYEIVSKSGNHPTGRRIWTFVDTHDDAVYLMQLVRWQQDRVADRLRRAWA